MLWLFLFALSVQSAPSLDEPGIVLLRSGDTVFLSPTKSIDRAGPIRRATLVEIYPTAVEGWEVVRRDSVVELNCAEERIRILATQDFDDRDIKRGSPQPAPGEWSQLDPLDFPRAVLLLTTCSDADLDSMSYDRLEDELPRLRRGLR